ncbi:MAG: hypothetical protein IPJ82_04075 [Lewinellaceae bacterium]|nr:hypothetical protein [Lewinellaceae bacterium]
MTLFKYTTVARVATTLPKNKNGNLLFVGFPFVELASILTCLNGDKNNSVFHKTDDLQESIIPKTGKKGTGVGWVGPEFCKLPQNDPYFPEKEPVLARGSAPGPLLARGSTSSPLSFGFYPLYRFNRSKPDQNGVARIILATAIFLRAGNLPSVHFRIHPAGFTRSFWFQTSK